MSSRGVIFLVLDRDQYLREALMSAKSIRKYSPMIERVLITNLDLTISQKKVFDDVIIREFNTNPFKAKIQSLKYSPFEQTLFLDTDTRALSPIDSIFQKLNNLDLVLAKRPLLNDKGELLDFKHPCHFNTGVILYRRSKSMDELIDEWFRRIDRFDNSAVWSAVNCDQTIFNEEIIDQKVLYRLGLKLGEFDNVVWNVRPAVYLRLKDQEKIDLVKLLHARDYEIGALSNFQKIKRKLKQLIRYK